MDKVRTFQLRLIVLLTFSMVFSWSDAVWGHGEETKIVPATLNVKAGSELKVTVNGLEGTKTVDFRLTGIAGKYNLGKFPIDSDDFTQVLRIPEDLPPGSYRLTVEGGGKNAKVVITIY